MSHFPDDYISYVEQNYDLCFYSPIMKTSLNNPSLKNGFVPIIKYTNSFFANYDECLSTGKLTCYMPDNSNPQSLYVSTHGLSCQGSSNYYGTTYDGGTSGLIPTCLYGSSQILLELTLKGSNPTETVEWLSSPAYTDTELR